VPEKCLHSENTVLIAGWMKAVKNLVRVQIADHDDNSKSIKKIKLKFIFPKNFDKIPLTTIFTKRHFYQIVQLLKENSHLTDEFITDTLLDDLNTYNLAQLKKVHQLDSRKNVSQSVQITKNLDQKNLEIDKIDFILNKLCRISNLDSTDFTNFCNFFNSICENNKILSFPLETIDTILEILHKNAKKLKERNIIIVDLHPILFNILTNTLIIITRNLHI